jgi:hypothetical protein
MEKEFTKADFIELMKPKPKKVAIKDIGTFYLRTMTVNERDAYELSVYDKGKSSFGNIRAGILVRTICDANGQRLFSDDPAEIESFGNVASPALIEKLFTIARKINWFSEQDIQELEKNSESDPQDV